MSIIIVILYTIFFSWLIIKIPFIKKTGLNKQTIILIFSIKILAGLAYAYFYQLPAYKDNADTFRFFEYSKAETDILIHHPIQFFKDIFAFGYEDRGSIFAGENSYWNDLKSNVIIKILAICNVFTFKNYYANIVIFNFTFLFGLVAIYRLLAPLFSNRKWLLLISVFFIPSFLFWCSGIHKDGLLFSAMGVVIYLFDKLLKHGFSFGKAILVFILLALIFTLRNFIFFSLLLCLMAWFFASFKPNKFLQRFLFVYLGAALFFFTSHFIHPKLNFQNIIIAKQQEFNALSGGSKVITDSLKPNLSGFASYLPYAIDMAFLRPHLSEIKNKSYIPAILETYFLIIVTLSSFVFKKKDLTIPPIIIVLFIFAVTTLLITGYTITFSGAIVRYKSLVLPLFITSILYIFNSENVKFWQSIK